MSIKIWFNNCFARAYHIIKLIKNNPDGIDFEIFGTNLNQNSPVLRACDYSEVEPYLKNDQYVDYCLEFCKKHNIDIFIPYKNLELISDNRRVFQDAGIKLLLCGSQETVAMVSKKNEFYDFAREHDLIYVPVYHIVNTAGGFLEKYKELRENGYDVCIKPAKAQGGTGFRIIDEKADSIEKILGFLSYKISPETAFRALSTAESFEDLLVMEYLSGYEYTLDCLAHKGKLLAVVPRRKLDTRVRLLEYKEELIKISEKFAETLNMSYVFNIQVKYNNDIPKLIEVNPRMSAGTHISSMSGVNFPYLGIKLLMGEEVRVPEVKYDLKVTQLETEILL
jgi:biotin carboxylase